MCPLCILLSQDLFLASQNRSKQGLRILKHCCATMWSQNMEELSIWV